MFSSLGVSWDTGSVSGEDRWRQALGLEVSQIKDMSSEGTSAGMLVSISEQSAERST